MNPMPVEVNNWGPASLIVFGYLAAAFWQNKRFDDMKDWFKAEIGRVEGELKAEVKRTDGVLGAKLDGLTVRVKALEDEIRSPQLKR